MTPILLILRPLSEVAIVAEVIVQVLIHRVADTQPRSPVIESTRLTLLRPGGLAISSVQSGFFGRRRTLAAAAKPRTHPPSPLAAGFACIDPVSGAAAGLCIFPDLAHPTCSSG